MNITGLKIRKAENAGNMKAVISITFDDEIALHDVKIIEGEGKFFLAMPSRKMPDGSYRDIVHPINSEVRARLEEEVIQKYRAAMLEENE